MRSPTAGAAGYHPCFVCNHSGISISAVMQRQSIDRSKCPTDATNRRNGTKQTNRRRQALPLLNWVQKIIIRLFIRVELLRFGRCVRVCARVCVNSSDLSVWEMVMGWVFYF
jgi:hypothetical protein